MHDSLAHIARHRLRSAAEIAALSARLCGELIEESSSIDAADFTAIHRDDLGWLFAAYDQEVFDCRTTEALGNIPLSFRLSQRMTSAGGKTSRFRRRDRNTGAQQTRYEIAVSTALLFQTFEGNHRPITVTGLVCHNRLEALLRVFEHELVHLVEMLVWENSNCRRDRFQSIAHRLFGHTAHTHALITPREHAHQKFGIKAGDRVQFDFEGRRHEGIVNRITKRATVLVEDKRGERYSNGRRYAKFYIPIDMLRRVH